MKKNYLFFLFAFLVSLSYSQEDIQSDLGVVSSNVDSGSKAIYLEDLQYHIKHSKKAINRAIKNLKTSNCSKALELCNEISGLLNTAEFTNDLKEGRTFLINTKDLIVKTFYEYEICTVNVSNSRTGNEALTELEQQQSNLKQQQLELEQRAKEIKLKLAEQEAKESQLKKQKFIALNEKATAANLKAHNDLLAACNCNTSISDIAVNTTDLTSKSIEYLKNHYLNKEISISKSYLDKLKMCKN